MLIYLFNISKTGDFRVRYPKLPEGKPTWGMITAPHWSILGDGYGIATLYTVYIYIYLQF